MIIGTANYGEVPDACCALCDGYYKADELEDYDYDEAHYEIECEICGFRSVDLDNAHYCCKDNPDDRYHRTGTEGEIRGLV